LAGGHTEHLGRFGYIDQEDHGATLHLSGKFGQTCRLLAVTGAFGPAPTRLGQVLELRRKRRAVSSARLGMEVDCDGHMKRKTGVEVQD